MHPYLVEELTRARMDALRLAADEFRRVRRAERPRRRRRHAEVARTSRTRIVAPADTRG